MTALSTAPVDTHEDEAGARAGLVLVSLMLGTFMTGSAELLPVGLLPRISAGLDVSVASAGSLVSVYALGLAIGGPVLTAVTIRLDRRHVLLASLSLFVVLVVSPAVVPHFGWFVATRLCAGALQGLFLAAAFTTATSVLPPERAGRAFGTVIAGFAVSTVVGLPLGLVAGEAVGWRGAVAAVGVGALLVVALVHAVVPAVPGSDDVGVPELRAALSPQVLAMLALSVLVFAAPAAVMTYLVPLLEGEVGLSGAPATAVMVGYGLACVAGSFLGGRWADVDPARALVLAASGVAASFVVLFLGRGEVVVAVVAIASWGVLSSSAPASVQHRTMSFAGTGGVLASSLPASAASAGIALGSSASGVAYASAGLPAVVVTGALIALAAAGVAVATRGMAAQAPAVCSRIDARVSRT